jgi:hypothetical protein
MLLRGKLRGYFSKTLIAAAALKVWSLNFAATFFRVGMRKGATARIATKRASESKTANLHGITDYRLTNRTDMWKFNFAHSSGRSKSHRGNSRISIYDVSIYF